MTDQAGTSGEENRAVKYPKSIFFIIGNEFCERFTYYGLRTVLTLFLIKQLMYDENEATVIYHLFTMMAYFTPLLGAIIADSWLGKFKTIFYLSVLYTIGSVVLSVGSAPLGLDTMKVTALIGLAIIGLGTGGIKPCVSAFGGDQFAPTQEKERQRFFSLFYLSINLGSVISTALTPILRADVHCFGQESCYPLAFGVPALLMIVALLIFLAGKSLYVKNPPEGNIIVTVSKCICYALKKKSKSTEKKRDHWLDYADDKFDKTLISDIKSVLRVLVLYLPLPIFWTLFDQQGSRWTLQATRMDGEVYGYHIKPDQVQVLNPLLIIAFIPLFDYCVYPLLSKCNLLKKPLQRIAAGGLVAALSFVIAGFVEISVEGTLPILPKAGESELYIINNSPCPLKISPLEKQLDAFQSEIVPNLIIGETHSWEFHPNCTEIQVEPRSFVFNSTHPLECMMITIKSGRLEMLKVQDSKVKADTAEPRIRIFYNMPKSSENFTFLFLKENTNIPVTIDVINSSSYGATEYKIMPPGRYKIYIPYNETAFFETPIAEATFKVGASYILSVFNEESGVFNVKMNLEVFQTVQANTIHLFYQIPQYLVITAGEIMFSITGLEFSYSQSPTSMKSLVSAAWLLTVAFGNLVVLIIAKAALFEKQSYELFFFATLMALDMLIFAILAYFYKYVNHTNSNSVQLATSSGGGKTNEGFEEETNLKNES